MPRAPVGSLGAQSSRTAYGEEKQLRADADADFAPTRSRCEELKASEPQRSAGAVTGKCSDSGQVCGRRNGVLAGSVRRATSVYSFGVG